MEKISITEEQCEEILDEDSDEFKLTEQRLQEAEEVIKFYGEPPFYSADAKKYLNKYKEDV